MKEVAVIGLGTAGIHAVRTMTANLRDIHITVFERRKYPTYSPCGLPYALEGLTTPDEIVHPFPSNRSVDVKLAVEVTGIDAVNKKLTYTDGEGQHEHRYDELVYAGGAEPFIPPIKGAKELLGRGVFVLRTVEDLKGILAVLDSGVKQAVVIGAGAIGLETAAALVHKMDSVDVIEMLPQVMPNLDGDMAKLVQKHLEEMGVKFHLEQAVSGFEKKDGKLMVSYGNEELAADMVLLSVGVRPNTGLLDGIATLDKGYIKVDRHMQVSEHIWAAGDCVTTENELLGRYSPSPYATAAMKQGIVIGLNLAGIEAEYTGASFTLTSLMGGLEVASTGVKANEGLKSVRVRHLSRPGFMGGKPLTLKIIFNDAGLLRGAQAVGEGATSVINSISPLMKKNGTLTDLLSAEMAYCPGVSELLNVIQLAAEMAIRRLKNAPLKDGVCI